MSIQIMPLFTHDQKNFLVPFKYHYNGGFAEPIDSRYFPFGQTKEQFVHMWWNWKTLNATVRIDHGPTLQHTTQVTLSRQIAGYLTTPPELGLMLPGNQGGLFNPDGSLNPDGDNIEVPSNIPGTFQGSISSSDWNGTGGEMYVSIVLRLCNWRLAGVGATPCARRLYWTADDLLFPSVILDAEYVLTAGVEVGGSVFSYETDSGATACGRATTPYGWFNLDTNADYYSSSQFELSISPIEYFDWNGARNPITGILN